MSRQRAIAHPIFLAFALLAALGLPALILGIAATREGFDFARVVAWACCVLGLMCLCGCIGMEIRGRAGGVLIDERNRYSLSRLQMLAWTTLLVASLYTLFIANAIRSDAALEIMKIEVDWNLVAASGFSVISLLGAPMALSRKADAPSAAGDLEKANAQLMPQQGLSGPVATVGRVVVKGSTADARLADLFRGEDVQNAMLVDLPRLQMLLVSTVVILGYCVTMVIHLGAVDPTLHSLPAFSPTVLSLILISHSGYLAGKIIPTTPASTGAVADQTSRALVVAKDAVDLVARADALVAQTRPGTPQFSRFQQILADARLVSSDVSAWTSDARKDGAAELATLERRLAVVQSALAVTLAQTGAAVDMPDVGVVKRVQALLTQSGFDAPQTGADDAQTRAAIDAWTLASRTDPASLATSRQRFYEELLQLI